MALGTILSLMLGINISINISINHFKRICLYMKKNSVNDYQPFLWIL